MSKIAYEKEELEKLCRESSGYNEVLKKTGRVKGGKNLTTLKKYIQLYNIDISHFTGSTNPNKYKETNNSEKVICKQCGKIKDIYLDFYWSNGKRSRIICKDCVKKNEKEKYYLKIAELDNLKKQSKCKKCGETRFYLFDFHHRNPEEKEFTISKHMTISLDKLYNEIEKCDILCSNCHREWHYLNSHNNITYEEWLNE